MALLGTRKNAGGNLPPLAIKINETGALPVSGPMFCCETLRVAIHGLRTNRLRACLTALGVVMGSACLVVVVTIGLTGKHYVQHTIEAAGSNLVYARRYAPSPTEPNFRTDEITVSDLAAIKELPNVRYAAGVYDRRLPIHLAGADRVVSVVGITDHYPEVRNLQLIAGRFFDGTDSASREKICIVSTGLKKFLGGEDAVGKVIRVGDFDLTIVGVFREQSVVVDQTELGKEAVLVPMPVMSYYTGDDFLRGIYVQAMAQDDVRQVTASVRQTLAGRHHPDEEFNVENLTAILSAANQISTALGLVLLAVAGIALFLSGIGIMNIMLLTVSQRTHEIGVMKVVGATRFEIQCQFLAEALIISVGGAFIGVGLSILLPLSSRFLLPDGLYVPVSWTSVAISFLVSSMIGIIFGFLPARRASMLTAIDALRFES